MECLSRRTTGMWSSARCRVEYLCWSKVYGWEIRLNCRSRCLTRLILIIANLNRLFCLWLNFADSLQYTSARLIDGPFRPSGFGGLPGCSACIIRGCCGFVIVHAALLISQASLTLAGHRIIILAAKYLSKCIFINISLTQAV